MPSRESPNGAFTLLHILSTAHRTASDRPEHVVVIDCWLSSIVTPGRRHPLAQALPRREALQLLPGLVAEIETPPPNNVCFRARFRNVDQQALPCCRCFGGRRI